MKKNVGASISKTEAPINTKIHSNPLEDIESLTDETEIETDFEPPKVYFNSQVQTSPELMKRNLVIQTTFIGESFLPKPKQYTLVHLPHDFVEIENKNFIKKTYQEELDYILNNTKNQSFTSSIEIFPLESKKKLTFIDYNKDENTSSYRRIEKHLLKTQSMNQANNSYLTVIKGTIKGMNTVINESS